MDVDSQPAIEETILVGDDLMLGLPSPIIPPEIASHVLEGVDLCDGVLRNLFLCLQINDIEPFCQDEIVLYRECAEKRDKELRQRLSDSEHKLGLSMPIEEAKERAAQLQSEVTSLERHMILASGIQGMEGFRQRWSLHGRLEDTKRRLEALNQGIEKRKPDKIHGEPKGDPARHSAAADGPEYVAQCPIRPGGRYTHRFTIEAQEGTLWWWLRATLHGAFIIYPKHSCSYPFPKPNKVFLFLFWFKVDVTLQTHGCMATPRP
ncbi:hypothetical protein MUK42_35918 [Musa troglodytarum]|uniref:Uncharacterized protein n=1 Tax=Musa troglodytarum TaxID=320322 RepID=A0A9E7FMF1_9LILI|nr:hypothetical protein MUK42_35918 [Musa troglodytarum]